MPPAPWLVPWRAQKPVPGGKKTGQIGHHVGSQVPGKLFAKEPPKLPKHAGAHAAENSARGPVIELLGCKHGSQALTPPPVEIIPFRLDDEDERLLGNKALRGPAREVKIRHATQ